MRTYCLIQRDMRNNLPGDILLDGVDYTTARDRLIEEERAHPEWHEQACPIYLRVVPSGGELR